MLSKRSIRDQFLVQLLVASAALIIIFSTLLYAYIKSTIIDERKNELLHYAQNVISNQALYNITLENLDSVSGITIEMICLQKKDSSSFSFNEEIDGKKSFLSLYYPYSKEEKTYLKIKKEISQIKRVLVKIFNSIVLLNFIGFVIIILYAVALSDLLTRPVRALASKLARMREDFMTPIKIYSLPIEFRPLGNGINKLIGRIQTFANYQKELFIGTAHELKTPLAVMKLKNEVTLIKKRSEEEYIDTIKLNIETINEMNKIVGDILNIGRQESAQFEPPKEVDVIKILAKKGADFKLLAEKEKKHLTTEFKQQSYISVLQPTLLNHIIQNFLQNALKFTPKGKNITMQTSLIDEDLRIEIIDEGSGLDENSDLFAPFKRIGNQSGVGLGLFLAKNASEAMDAHISLENRKDGVNGAVATLIISNSLSCEIPNR